MTGANKVRFYELIRQPTNTDPVYDITTNCHFLYKELIREGIYATIMIQSSFIRITQQPNEHIEED